MITNLSSLCKYTCRLILDHHFQLFLLDSLYYNPSMHSIAVMLSLSLKIHQYNRFSFDEKTIPHPSQEHWLVQIKSKSISRIQICWFLIINYFHPIPSLSSCIIYQPCSISLFNMLIKMIHVVMKTTNQFKRIN